MLDKSKSSLSLSHQLASFLLIYRSTPHSVTGQTPVSLFLKREIRNRFTLLKPNLEQTVNEKQDRQVQYHDKSGVKMRQFKVGERVYVKKFRRKGERKWISGTIVERTGTLIYKVDINGITKLIHMEHIRAYTPDLSTSESSTEPPNPSKPVPRSYDDHYKSVTYNSSDISIMTDLAAESSEISKLPKAPPTPLINSKSVVKQSDGCQAKPVETVERRYPLRLRTPKVVFDL